MRDTGESTIHRLDLPETTIHHGQIIKKKKFLRKLYQEWYQGFKLEVDNKKVDGQLLEIGSGGGFLKEVISQVITSDVLELPECDLCCSADALPFENQSLRAVFMLDVLHHLPEVRKFFREMERTLTSGGLVYMIEPANTFFSRLILKNFHHEDFNENAVDWSFESLGPLSSSNQALPWIIFFRDRKKFEKEFPDLKIKYIRLHTPFRYLITGGLSYNVPIPGWSFNFVSSMERMLKPLYGYCAMFQTIVLEKK